MNEHFQPFLNELAEALGFSSLTPDAQGACMLRMKDGGETLLFEFDEQLVPNTILLSSFVCPLPLENRSDIFEEMLKANHVLEEILSAKPDENSLYLHRRLHPEIQAEELKKVIFNFIEEIKNWKRKVEEIAQMAPKPHRFPLPPSSLQIRV